MTDEQFPADSFPRQQARTRRYTLGRPARSPSRRRTVRGLRSYARAAREDPVGCLWVFDVPSGTERLVFDPSVAVSEGHLSAEAT